MYGVTRKPNQNECMHVWCALHSWSICKCEVHAYHIIFGALRTLMKGVRIESHRDIADTPYLYGVSYIHIHVLFYSAGSPVCL